MNTDEVDSWHVGHEEIPSMLGCVAILRSACIAAVPSGPRSSIRSQMLSQLVLVAISATKVPLGEHLALEMDFFQSSSRIVFFNGFLHPPIQNLCTR